MTACSSCGRLCLVVVVLEHHGRRGVVEWSLGRCCFGSAPVPAPVPTVRRR